MVAKNLEEENQEIEEEKVSFDEFPSFKIEKKDFHIYDSGRKRDSFT